MKKLTVFFLIALILLSSAAALAFTGEGYPAYDGNSASNTLYGSFNTSSFMLEFDPVSSQWSEGYVTACFFAFDADQSDYLELFLILPDTAAAGDSFGTESQVSAMLYEVHIDDSEDLYYSYLGMPTGSYLNMMIDQISSSGSMISVSGIMNATLVKDDSFGNSTSVELSDMHFDFCYDASGAANATPEPQQPQATPEPDWFNEVPFPFAPQKTPVPAPANGKPVLPEEHVRI